MLCPNVMNAGDMLCRAYGNVKRTDSFTYGCMNTSIGFLSPDPIWLGSLRTRMGMLRDTCSKWQLSKPDIWSQLLLPFVNYYTTFKGFTEASKDFGSNTSIWLSALEQLKNELTLGKNVSQYAENQFEAQINDLQNLEVVITSSINDAWAALSDEETKMVEIASEITKLQDKINQLQVDLTSSEISSGKSYVQSVVKIGYDILITAGTGIPYMTIVSMVFTIGQIAYDLITKSAEINESLEKIADLQVEATEEAQALAATKSVLQIITNLKTNMIALKNDMPDFSQMWANEIDKINQVINSINSGVDPSIYIDLKSMPTALATWETLADYVPKLISGPQQGKDVILTIKK